MADNSSGFDAASAAKLRAVAELLREAQVDGTVRKAIVKDLRAPATAVAARQRAAVRALTGAAPKEWKAHAAANVRVDMFINTRSPSASIRMRRSSSGPARRPGWNLNRGEWRHPVFGRRDQPWVTQRVTAGWFDKTGQAAKPAFIVAAGIALEKAAVELGRRIDAANYWRG